MIIYYTNCIPLWLLLEDSLQQLRVDILLHCIIERGLTQRFKTRSWTYMKSMKSWYSKSYASPTGRVFHIFVPNFIYMYIWKIHWFWWTTYTPAGMIRTSMNERVPVVQAFVVSKPVSAFRQLVLSWKKCFALRGFRSFPLLVSSFTAGKISFTKSKLQHDILPTWIENSSKGCFS